MRAESASLPRSSVGTYNSRSRRLEATVAPSGANSRVMRKGYERVLRMEGSCPMCSDDLYRQRRI